MKLALVGGTGREGSALAVRWTQAGHHVVIGSRTAERAQARAAELSAEAGVPLTGSANDAACDGADVVVLCIPYDVHEAVLRELQPRLQGRIVVDLTVPLKPPKVREVHLPAGGSAAQEAAAMLGPEARLVAAYHHISSVALTAGHTDRCDVLICGDDAEAKEVVIQLTRDLGMRGLDAGPLRNAVALESLTPVLLYLNKRYQCRDAGIVVTGLSV
jgi:hypothetical protein